MIQLFGLSSDNWDDVVRGFANFDVYYLSGYARAFAAHGDGEPLLFLYEDANLRAMNVVMKRDVSRIQLLADKISVDTYFDVVTPYGYGGFLFEGYECASSVRRLDDEYSAFCKSLGIVCEFVRFHPIRSKFSALNEMYVLSVKGKTVTMNLKSKNSLFTSLDSKNRNVIRKAMKAGIEVYWGRSPDLYDRFMSMYTMTMNRANANDYYHFGKEFFKAHLDALKEHAMLFYASYRGEIIAMCLILHANGLLHYHLSASEHEYSNLSAMNLLLFEIANWGCANGYSVFHLGGGVAAQEDNLYKFKKSFNKQGNDAGFVVGTKIFCSEAYAELVALRCLSPSPQRDALFFPSYRA